MIKNAKKEYVFTEGIVTPSCHASTVLPLEDGRVLAAWFGGKHEKDDDVEIYIAERSPQGEWCTPVCVSEKDSIPHWNPVLYRRDNGDIILYYKYGKEIPDWITKYMVSSDGGKTWSEPKELVPGDTSGGRGPVKDKCIKLSNGSVLAPASTEKGFARCFTELSFDDGITWERGDFFETPKYKGAKVWLIQPTAWEDGDGVLHCFMRSDKGAIYASASTDMGRSWSKPARTRLPNNNSGIDLDRDEKGRIWLVYNPVDVNWGVRHPLSIAVSSDNGKHFREILLPEPGNGEFSYPAIVCDGSKIHITYTYKRKQIVYWQIETE